MQLVINITEELYEANIRGLEAEEVWDLRTAIQNGTPLPKGHGRLIDAKTLSDEYDKYCVTECSCCPRYYRTLDGVVSCGLISDADTLIEADKAESEDKE